MKKGEKEAYGLLDEMGIEYKRYEHLAADTMEACDEIDKTTGVAHCKNLFLTNRQRTNFFLIMMRGGKRFRTAEASKQLGTARLSFAEDELLYEKLGLTPGSVTPLGLMNDEKHEIKVAMDKDLIDDDMICVHPCINTASVTMKTSELIRLIHNLGYELMYIELTGEL